MLSKLLLITLLWYPAMADTESTCKALLNETDINNLDISYMGGIVHGIYFVSGRNGMDPTKTYETIGYACGEAIGSRRKVDFNTKFHLAVYKKLTSI